MNGTARRDLVFFQRGAGYASGLNPYQEGGSKRHQKTLHEMYCSKTLHAPRSSGIKRKGGKRDKQQVDAVVLRRSTRVRKPKMRGSGKKGRQKGGLGGFLGGLGTAVVNGLAGLVVGGLQNVIGGVASQLGRGKKRSPPFRSADMYRAIQTYFARGGQVGSGKKAKAFFGKLKKVASKIVANPEVRKVAKNLMQKAANKGIDMVVNKASQIKMVKELMTPAHINSVKSVVNKQIAKI